MIKLVQITGESYDLETGKEHHKSIVLTNGVRNLSIEVNDDTVREIIQMQLEVAGQPNVSPCVSPYAGAGGSGVAQQQVTKLIGRPIHAGAHQDREVIKVMEESPFTPELAEAAEAPEDEDPGFDYADSSTGTMSI